MRDVLVEHSVERDRLPGSRVEHPRDVIGASVGMARHASTPGFLRHPALRATARVEQLRAKKCSGIGCSGCRKIRCSRREINFRRRRIGDVNRGDGAADEIDDVCRVAFVINHDAARRLPRNLIVLYILQVDTHDCPGSSNERCANRRNPCIVHRQAKDGIGILHDNPGIGAVRPPGHGNGVRQKEARDEPGIEVDTLIQVERCLPARIRARLACREFEPCQSVVDRHQPLSVRVKPQRTVRRSPRAHHVGFRQKRMNGDGG